MRPPIDVEQIRCAAEIETFAELESIASKQTLELEDAVSRRRKLLASSLRLDDALAPDATAAARQVMAAFGLSRGIELYQTQSKMSTARMVLSGDPIGVEFLGDYLGELDDGGLLAVIGHEVGHALAHVGDPKFVRVWALSQTASSTRRRAHAMASEITADRFGVLACADIDAVLRLEMRSAAGTSAGVRYDTAAYLAQATAVAQQVLDGTWNVSGSTHPEHYIRSYAEWLFAQTDVYARFTGKGECTRTMAEVDAIVSELLRSKRALEASPPPRALKKPTAEVGLRNDEPAPSASIRPSSIEELAVDILVEDTRRKVAAAGNAVAGFARTLSPSFERLTKVARAHFGERPNGDTGPKKEPDGEDPLEVDRRDLEARFEELERRAKGE